MPQPSSFYLTNDANQRLDLVRHLIENGEVLPIIRGPSGSGKSVLLEVLRSSAPENWVTCQIEGDADLLPDVLISAIATGYAWADIKDSPLDALVTRFTNLRQAGRLPVLLVDNAHLLPPAGLIVLLRLFERQWEMQSLLSIVLFGDTHIEDLLSKPQLRVMSLQALKVIDLPRLALEDAPGFMRHVLHEEGLTKDYEIDNITLIKLHRETHGTPGALKQAILEQLAQEPPKHTNTSQSSNWRTMVYALPAVLLVTSVIYVMTQNDEPDSSTTSQVQPEPELVVQNKLSEQLSVTLETNANDEPILVERAPTTAPAPTLSETIPQPEVIEEIKVPVEDQVEPVDTAALPITETSDVTPSEKSPVIDSPAEPDPAPIPQDAPTETSDVDTKVPSIKPTPVVTTTQTVNQEPKSEVTATPQKQTTDELVTWIMSRPDTHYTLQLMGLSSKASVDEFIDEFSLADKVFHTKTNLNGKPWYPLYWGDYPDKHSALNDRENLPYPLHQPGIWARPFSDLKKQLK